MTGGIVMDQHEKKQERDRLYNDMMELSRTLRSYVSAKREPEGSPNRERIERFPISEAEIRKALKAAQDRYRSFINNN